MEKLTWQEVEAMFCDINKNNLEHKHAVVVFKPESFNKPYSEVERSYRFSSDNKAFKSWCIGYSIFADCLDNIDKGVRIESYMRDGEPNWVPDYCYLVD